MTTTATSQTPRPRSARRTAHAALACALTALCVAGPLVAGPAAAAADDSGAGVTHVEVTGNRMRVLVAVPPDADVDLEGVTVDIDGTSATAEAQPAAGSGKVRRTAVLAIDTSDSMRGERAAAAHEAALTFLDTVPADVYVGIVTFDGQVATPLSPTLDRDDARSVVDGLDFGHGTRLFEGIEAAIALAGEDGQRSLLVLSDGADTTKTPLSDVTDALKDTDVLLDAVSLQAQDPSLATLAAAGNGQLISSKPDALAAAFAEEADALSRQVLVTVTVPDDVTATEGNVTVSLPTGTDTLTATAYTTVRAAAPKADAPTPVAAAASGSLQLPAWAMYAGIAAVGVGVLLLLLVLVPAKPKPLGAAARVDAYIGGQHSSTPARQTETLAPVREAATRVLSRNRGLEERIGLRLEGAGSELRPPEWLLVHSGIAAASTVLGLLLTGGSVLVGFIGLAIGVFGPWLYLGRRRAKRRKAFNAALPDALQLMAGALEAGLSLPQSADTIVKEGIEPISSEFRRALVETRLGVDLEDALEGVAERLESEDLGWVVMAIRIQRPIGGNLAELLATVAATMREREYMRRQVAALAAEGKLSAWVLGGLPPAFLLYLLLTNRDYVMPLFTTPMGFAMLAGAGTLLAVGVFWMSKMVKVEV
ncbi:MULTISPECIES: type II secretion system F family protein [unclassified Nocardioides]|uniref:type II secretion system F family protein n=1 Tax=unclassified Nocardioides TaxID=2615069 RepID=UPI0012E39DCD|nr:MULTISPECIES: type II secretion system F family protein [unclassified Nocardioides]